MTVLREPKAESRPATRPAREVFYPSSDGKPMAETDWHLTEMREVIDMLADRYRDAPDVYVAGNNFLYYVEGDPSKVVSPDVYVVFGVPKRQRRIYKLWEEGAAPAVAFEITSRKTRREDFGKKRDIYAGMGVDEYFLCDPGLDYLKPPLQGFHLDHAAGVYASIESTAKGRLMSQRLGLRLWMNGAQIQLADAVTGARLLRSAEVRERERVAERRAERERRARRVAEERERSAERLAAQEHAARQAAEAENARLRAEIERLRRDTDP